MIESNEGVLGKLYKRSFCSNFMTNATLNSVVMLEERLLLGVARFAKENNAEYKIQAIDSAMSGDGSSKPILAVLIKKDKDNYFSAQMNRPNGVIQPPLTAKLSTPAGPLYDQFCDFVSQAPFNISSTRYNP